jgi:hypothetical protein
MATRDEITSAMNWYADMYEKDISDTVADIVAGLENEGEYVARFRYGNTLLDSMHLRNAIICRILFTRGIHMTSHTRVVKNLEECEYMKKHSTSHCRMDIIVTYTAFREPKPLPPIPKKTD